MQFGSGCGFKHWRHNSGSIGRGNRFQRQISDVFQHFFSRQCGQPFGDCTGDHQAIGRVAIAVQRLQQLQNFHHFGVVQRYRAAHQIQRCGGRARCAFTQHNFADAERHPVACFVAVVAVAVGTATQARGGGVSHIGDRPVNELACERRQRKGFRRSRATPSATADKGQNTEGDC